MDTRLIEAEDFLRIYKRMKDMNAFWKLVSSCIERGWLAYLDANKELCKAMSGRGKVTFIKTKPKPKEEVKEDQLHTIRNDSSRRAVNALKQARRLEQVAYRLGLVQHGGMLFPNEKKERYHKLNVEAMYQVRKHVVWEIKWQKDMFKELTDLVYNQEKINPKIIPKMKLQAEKYQKMYMSWRTKAINESKLRKQKLYEAKARGHWDLCKELGTKTRASPIIAVNLQKKGPKGQAKGTVATDPTKSIYHIDRGTGQDLRWECSRCQREHRALYDRLQKVYL